MTWCRTATCVRCAAGRSLIEEGAGRRGSLGLPKGPVQTGSGQRKGAAVGLANLDDFESASHERSDADRTEAVWGAVKGLGAEQSHVLHLRFAAGLSYAEIAGALDIPVGTVRSRLHRGLKAIREKIKGYDHET